MRVRSFSTSVRALLSVVVTLASGATVAQTTTDYSVTELTFNGGTSGETITFDTATTVSVTDDSANASLDISIVGTTVRLKCGAQASPAECVLYADGSGGGVADADGDGVADGSDLCPNTATGATVDVNGCSDAQKDTDGDGVNDAADLCPGTATGATVDANGCSEAQNTSPTYCANAPSIVECSASVNFDSVYQAKGETTFFIPAGKVVSVPFTLDDVSNNPAGIYGYFQYTSFENHLTIGGPLWHMWYSRAPGGTAIQGVDCSVYYTLARGNIYWTQDPTYAAQVCNLGTGAGVVYVNYEVACNPATDSSCNADNPTRLNRRYEFDVARGR